MPARTILQLGDPRLWQPCAPAEPADASTQQLIRDLDDTLADFRARMGFGRGIAAPQIGDLRRVIFIRMPDASFCGPLVNPEITARSAELMELWDDCFSIPHLMVRLRRHAAVQVRYLDAAGQPLTLDATGALSELLQHEIDHLDGVLTVDRAASPRDLCTREEWCRSHAPPPPG